MFVCNLNPWNVEIPKVDSFSSPTSTWTVQKLLNNADARMPLSATADWFIQQDKL